MRSSSDSTFDELVADYYGVAEARRQETRPAIVLSLTASTDAAATTADEYIVDAPSVPARDEYVIDLPSTTRPAPAVSAPQPAPDAAPPEASEPAPAAEEREVDLLAPHEPATSAPAPAEQVPAAPIGDVAEATPLAPRSQSGASSVTEDDLVADLQAILSGQKVFDPASKQTVAPDRLGEPSTPSALPAPDGNGQAIFDRIAQSMQFANAYDLGTVELESRFADFDRTADERARPKEQRPVPSTAPAPSSEDFVRDLDQIRRDAATTPAPVAPVAPSDPEALEADRRALADGHHTSCGLSTPWLTREQTLSEPMYDSGEHVLAGDGLALGELRAGRGAGISFTYGQLLAMADLYGSADALLDADVTELEQVKRLVERSTAYYRGGRTDRSLDVSHDDWDNATGGRYLRLAEDNASHFSPTLLPGDPPVASNANHKAAWEGWHHRAITEAQRATDGTQPTRALVINAFGDHYLTDAFASGHLINKLAIIERFKASFFAGGALNADGQAFFGRVAEKAFVGNVARRFSALETTDYPVCKWGWCLRWHPNINSASRFASLLREAATQQPEKVGNFVAKALHDRLNVDGVEVTNGTGDGTWVLHGDGHLDPKSLEVMRKAVKRSVDDVVDPTIRGATVDFAARFAAVWAHVPRPTAAGQQRLTQLAREYTDPTSTVLSTAAAALIKDQADALIRVLLAEGKLKPA